MTKANLVLGTLLLLSYLPATADVDADAVASTAKT
jgi:hypothetical protein